MQLRLGHNVLLSHPCFWLVTFSRGTLLWHLQQLKLIYQSLEPIFTLVQSLEKIISLIEPNEQLLQVWEETDWKNIPIFLFYLGEEFHTARLSSGRIDNSSVALCCLVMYLHGRQCPLSWKNAAFHSLMNKLFHNVFPKHLGGKKKSQIECIFSVCKVKGFVPEI